MRKLCRIFDKISVDQFYRIYGFFILNTAFYGAEYGLLSSKTWQHWYSQAFWNSKLTFHVKNVISNGRKHSRGDSNDRFQPPQVNFRLNFEFCLICIRVHTRTLINIHYTYIIHTVSLYLYLPKIRITSKKALNKSCSKLNFVQESPRAHMSIFPWSGARGLERLARLEYYSIGKQ